MAEKRRIIRIEGPPTTRIRYGRATLTVAQSGGILMSELGEGVEAYERGELTAEKLCQRFARTRVKEHSPSFSWDDADPERVLKLVVEASETPRFESVQPEHVADRLVAGAGEEREAVNASLKQFGDALRAPPKINKVLGISRMPGLHDSLKGMREAGNLRKRLGLDQNALGLAGGFAERLRPHLDAVRGLKGITRLNNDALRGFRGIAGFNNDTLRGFRGIAGFDNDQLKRISGVAGFKAIDPKLFEAGGWMRRLPDPAPWLRGLQEQIGAKFEALKLTLPGNWRELTSQEMRDVVDLMKTEGLNLAWAPRPEILHQLVAADAHERRCEILVEHREEIIADVEQVLGEVTRNDLEAIVVAVVEAIAAYRDGHPAPAQTYASAVLGEVLHSALGYEAFGEAKREFREKDPLHDVGYAVFPFYAVGHALARTLDRFKDAGDGFNRNLTQHRIGTPHTEPNLLMVLLLLAGLLREVERLLNRHDAREEAEAA
jgi:hypothetical protein